MYVYSTELVQTAVPQSKKTFKKHLIQIFLDNPSIIYWNNNTITFKISVSLIYVKLFIGYFQLGDGCHET